MKRLFCVLLCLLLAFSLFACGKTAQPETPATTDPAAEPTTEPSTAPVSAAPTAEAAVFSLKTLPEIGAFVSDEKKAYFFDDGPHDSFEARDDYGEIVPYCVSEKYFATDWSYTDEETGEVHTAHTMEDEAGYHERYGFATADGRIITSDIYYYVSRYEAASGEVLYAAYTAQVFEMIGAVYLIAGDGSTVLHLPEDDTDLHVLEKTENGSGKGLLTVRNYNSGRLRLMDFAGRVLYEYVPPASGEDEMPYIEYADSDGLIVRRDDDAGVSQYVRQTYDGRQIVAFSKQYGALGGVYGNGVLLMGDWSDWKRLVSMDGKALTDGCLELHWSDYFGCFLGETDGEMQRYDADGKKIGELVEDFGALEKDSDYCYLYDPEDQTLLDASFQKVPLSVDSGEIVLVEPLYGDWSRPGYCPLLVRTDTDDLYVFGNSGKRLAKLQDVLYETWDSDEDGVNDEVRPGVEERAYNLSEHGGVIFARKKTGIEIVDTQTGVTTTVMVPHVEESGWDSTLSDSVFFLSYRKDEDSYQWYYDLYRRKNGERLLAGAVIAQSFGDRIVAATPTHSYLMDETGKVLLCLRNDKLV